MTDESASTGKAANTDRVIAVAAATMPPATPIETREVVEAVQEKMKSLDYVDGGKVDGHVGDKMMDEILALRRREGLPLVDANGKALGIDAELLAKLQVAAPKVLPIEQVTATSAEIAPKVDAVRTTRWAKFWAKVGAWNAGLVTFIFAVLERFEDASKYLTPVKNFAGEVPGYVWIGSAGFVAIFLALYLGKTETSLTDAYRSGTVKDDNVKEAG